MSSSVTRVEELFSELKLADRVTRVADNVWTLQKGAATVQIVAAPELIVATACVAEGIPAQGREDFFRMLLTANIQLLGAFFTLEANDSIRINQVLPVDWLQATELAFIVGNVANRADEWSERLRGMVSGERGSVRGER